MTFAAYCREKALAAERAALVPFETWSEDTTGVDLLPLGSLWTRTWWTLGDTVTEYTDTAKASLGTWDTRFDDDLAAWRGVHPPLPACTGC